jgi:hypothetical protein
MFLMIEATGAYCVDYDVPGRQFEDIRWQREK